MKLADTPPQIPLPPYWGALRAYAVMSKTISFFMRLGFYFGFLKILNYAKRFLYLALFDIESAIWKLVDYSF